MFCPSLPRTGTNGPSGAKHTLELGKPTQLPRKSKIGKQTQAVKSMETLRRCKADPARQHGVGFDMCTGFIRRGAHRDSKMR
jgi:hypothetical protein